jgi:diamine N-acetyltransferase
MMGPPLFPETPIPTWEQFCNDYVMCFFDGTQEEVGRCYVIEAEGEAVGHISYSQMDTHENFAELDIWMRAAKYCGRGYGSDALRALVQHLHDRYHVTEFILRPSRRNPRAIRAYARAGFVPLSLTNEEQTALYGPGDYEDTVVLCKKMAAR